MHDHHLQAKATDTDMLAAYFSSLPPGPIADTQFLEGKLANCWDELAGDSGGMTAKKLFGRMEDVCWQPPLLTFTIERHGGFCLGASRAELQKWEVDIEAMTAGIAGNSYRQIATRSAAFNAKPVAEEVAALIKAGKKDPRLKWISPTEVRVQVGLILPGDSAVKQTLAGRRRRFREELESAMAGTAWRELGRHKWVKNQRHPR